jgi:hypothetical protein
VRTLQIARLKRRRAVFPQLSASETLPDLPCRRIDHDPPSSKTCTLTHGYKRVPSPNAKENAVALPRQSGKHTAGTAEQDLGQSDSGQYGQVGTSLDTKDNSKGGKRLEEQARRAIRNQDAKRDEFASGNKRFTQEQ